MTSYGEPRLVELLAEDRDRCDLITSSWLASAQELLLKRGRAPSGA